MIMRLATIPTTRTGSQTTIKIRIIMIRSQSDHDDHESNHCGEPDSSSTKSENNRTWQAALKLQDHSHEIEITELKEDHQASITTLKQSLEEEAQVLIALQQTNDEAARAIKILLQKRVKQLTQEESALEARLESGATTIQQTTSAAQESQAKFDEMKQKYECLVRSTLHENNEKNQTIEQLRQEKERLGNIVFSLQLEQAREATTAATDQTISTSAMEQLQELEQKLEKTSEDNGILAAGLATNQIIATQLQERMMELNHALEQSPNEVANIRGVIELKDHMLSVSESRASETLSALTQLLTTSGQEKVIATREIAELKIKLTTLQSSNAALQEAKTCFQRTAEEVLEMQMKETQPTELFTAMEFFFQQEVSDNKVLVSGVLRLQNEISSHETQTISLETEIRELRESVATKHQCLVELEQKAFITEEEVGRLQMEINALPLDFERTIRHKDVQIQQLEGYTQAF